METELKRLDVDFLRIDGIQTENVVTDLGVAGSPTGRGIWSMTQCQKLLRMIADDGLGEDDVLFFEEFWQPGIEAVAYALTLKGLAGSVRMYAYCWAQSVDEYDFTTRMLPWIRHFEEGIAMLLDGIFVACNAHKFHMLRGGVGTYESVHVTGHCYNRESVEGVLPVEDRPERIPGRVIFTGRWDVEKNPLTFLRLVEAMKKVDDSDRYEFVVTTSAPTLRSNDYRLGQALSMAVDSGRITLLEGLSKKDYYKELCKAEFLFNCASQDYVSFGLLEGLTFGCTPVYPAFRSFVEVFKEHPQFLYPHGDSYEAAIKIAELHYKHGGGITDRERDELLLPFSYSVDKMVTIMEDADPGKVYDYLRDRV